VQNNASLEIDCIPKPTYKRQGDEYIMDVVCATATVLELDRDFLEQYTDAEIRQVYYCKSYLKVKRVSDLCTADGVFILPSILKGELSIRQCASKLEDIRQDRPSKNRWSTRRNVLRTLCTQGKKVDTQG
jgi:hypothetical protein